MTKASKIAKAAAALAAKDVAPPRTELEALSRELRAAAANEVEPIIPAIAEKNGSYVKEGNRTLRNRRSTPIARWRDERLLSDTQNLAIDYCIKLWERACRFTGLTMDLMKITGQPPASGWAQQEALDELQKFKDRVPFKYWDIFENVCRFDMPTGVAGSQLQGDRNAVNMQTRTIVCFVADLIATWKRF